MSDESPALSAQSIVGQLASPARLRVVAALVLGARTPSQVAEATQLGEDEVAAATTRLIRSGLVVADGAGLALRMEAFGEAARAGATKRPVDDFGAADPAVRKVLRAFIVDGRLTAIPAPGRKRHVVLEYLAAAFEPGVRYSEAQVNAALRVWHDDVAALRRYLVEDGLLTRQSGEYWRSGGWVDVLT